MKLNSEVKSLQNSGDFLATIPGEEIREKQNTQILCGSADCLRPWEQEGRLSLYPKLGLYKKVFILTLRY